MKKMYKAMALVLCAVLLVVGSVMGTLAYLQMTTGSVTNTFTVGNVTITLDEAPVDLYGNVIEGDRIAATTTGTNGNQYKLIPGHTYKKDPTITVQNGSEKCWVFAKLEDGLSNASIIEIDSTKWTDLGNGVYAYKETLEAGEKAVLCTEFTFDAKADPATYASNSIVITGYAVQAEGFEDQDNNGTAADEAWEASGFGTNP